MGLLRRRGSPKCVSLLSVIVVRASLLLVVARKTESGFAATNGEEKAYQAWV